MKVKLPTTRSKITCHGMLRSNTPTEYYEQFNLWVKREDLSCPSPGPNFSKARGVYARIENMPEKVIGCLDTYHSQGGHATARACQLLNKKCLVFYPEYKHEPGFRPPQTRAKKLGAELIGLPAGRSAVLYHQAKKLCEAAGGYMMPNALKLEETVDETAKETIGISGFDYVVISISSGTIAAGVIKGLGKVPTYLLHLGYSRSHEETAKYIMGKAGIGAKLKLIDEKYSYKDVSKDGVNPLWPCNPYYDLKAFRWWVSEGMKLYKGNVLFWNVG